MICNILKTKHEEQSSCFVFFNSTPQAYRLKGGACGTILIQMHGAHLNLVILHALRFRTVGIEKFSGKHCKTGTASYK